MGCQKLNCAFHHNRGRYVDGLFLPPSKSEMCFFFKRVVTVWCTLAMYAVQSPLHTLPFSLGREQLYFHFTDEGTELLV